MFRSKKIWGALAAILLAVGPSQSGATSPASRPPRRIVSLSLCADQYVLALADRSQIAALTHNATDPDMSAAAAQARGMRLIKGSAEEILTIDPDLVVGTPTIGGGALAALGGRRYRIVDVANDNSYADIVAQIRTIARAVGHAGRGEALIARMDKDLAALPRATRAEVAVYYQRRGYVTGAGTLVDELMGRVGLVNLARRLGKPPLSQIGLEEMIVAQPDYLIVERATDRVTDQGTEMLHHPLLKDIKRLRLPQAWTVCGGPAYVDAARSLAAQLRAGAMAGRGAR